MMNTLFPQILVHLFSPPRTQKSLDPLSYLETFQVAPSEGQRSVVTFCGQFVSRYVWFYTIFKWLPEGFGGHLYNLHRTTF